MASITAQILIGHTDQLNGGMLPTHCLLLSEGSKPVWILKNLDIMEDHHSSLTTIRWVPTEENLLEDALLMIYIYVLKAEEILKKARLCFPDLSTALINLNSDIEVSKLQELRLTCKELRYDYKIAISCFNGSSLEKSLSILKSHSMDAEVCTSSFKRYYNPWRDAVMINGSL